MLRVQGKVKIVFFGSHTCIVKVTKEYLYMPDTLLLKSNESEILMKIQGNQWNCKGNETSLNSSPALELVPKRLAGCQMPSCRGGIHGNPGTREPPKRAPANRHRHTETISGNNLPENTYPDDPTQQREGGEGANDKWYLATFKLITNRWAWEVVPKRLVGCQMPSCRGGIHGNLGTWEPPNQNTSPGAWRKEEPRTGVTWSSPTYPQAPVTENHGQLQHTYRGLQGRVQNPGTRCNRNQRQVRSRHCKNSHQANLMERAANASAGVLM